MTNHTTVILTQLDALLTQGKALAELASELLDQNDPLLPAVLARVEALNNPVVSASSTVYVGDPAPLLTVVKPQEDNLPFDDELADDYSDEYGDEDYEAAAPLPAAVGVNVNEDTGLVEVTGNVEEMAAVAADILAERALDEDGYEAPAPEASPLFSVLYTLLDEDAPELTDADIETILKHPISTPLNHLGRIRLINIVDESDEEYSAKRANFALVEEGTLPLAALAAQVLGYAGSHPFPRIGLVSARGEFHLA